MPRIVEKHLESRVASRSISFQRFSDHVVEKPPTSAHIQPFVAHVVRESPTYIQCVG